jgi:hypothetical protein
MLFLHPFEAGAEIVAFFRGDNPNIFPVAPPNAASGSLDIDDDGANDFLFFRDAGFVAGIQGYGSNRVISTLAVSPDQGTYVSPVFLGSILGPDTSTLSGDWHHHTDNVSNPSLGFTYSVLNTMQSEDAYIGVEFGIGESTHYGWIQYTGFYVAEFTFFSPDGPITVIGVDELGGFINSWGYETEPGVPIVVGIPEPSTWCIPFLTGLAVIGRRSRKNRGTTSRLDQWRGCGFFYISSHNFSLWLS